MGKERFSTKINTHKNTAKYVTLDFLSVAKDARSQREQVLSSTQERNCKPEILLGNANIFNFKDKTVYYLQLI